MTNQFLLAHRFKFIGWCLAIPSFIGLILLFFFEVDVLQFLKYRAEPGNLSFNNGSFSDEFFCIGFLIGMLLIAFSAEKIEDERVQHRRLQSFQWAVLANSVILMLAILLVYDTVFFSVMIYNMFTTLIIFILRFHYLVWRDNKTLVEL
jgi:hypothetical protein